MKLGDLREGQRVRITYEGVVEWASPDGSPAIRSGDWAYHPQQDMEGLKVELIEPEYEQGGIYKDDAGATYAYLGKLSGWKRMGYSGHYGYQAPIRPLVRLVPES